MVPALRRDEATDSPSGGVHRHRERGGSSVSLVVGDHHEAPLITSDRTIRDYYERAVW